jgi:hypothetical protein
MPTLERDLERLVKNEIETEALVAQLQERNAKLERVAQAARRYMATGFTSARRELRQALEDLDDGS